MNATDRSCDYGDSIYLEVVNLFCPDSVSQLGIIERCQLVAKGKFIRIVPVIGGYV